MGAGDAVWGGFTAFFSIWQLCILQFSPFFLAFIVGVYLVTPGQAAPPRVFPWTLWPCLAWAASFTLFYSLLIASGLPASRLLIARLDTLRIMAGVFILLVSLQIFFTGRIAGLARWHGTAWLSLVAFGLGIAFALMYSPCITPMLSDILAIATQRSTAPRGWYLAFFYGLGTCLAMVLFSLLALEFLRRSAGAWRRSRLLADICALVLLSLAILNITGLMTLYKAFALGFAL